MKAVILAGGFGTRISEETAIKPKPMIEIGGKPIIWHIMKIYATHDIKEFIVCCGYKGYILKEYFANYFLHQSDVTIDMKQNEISYMNKRAEDWKITLVDTGETTMTAGRIKRIYEYVKNDKYFLLTYGDGVGNINITKSIEFHEKKKKMVTLTAVVQPGRFGTLSIEKDVVKDFKEKPESSNYINGGFFVVNPKVIDLIPGDETVWEKDTLEKLAGINQLAAFKHSGFWMPMDTLREKKKLEELWNTNTAEWKIW